MNLVALITELQAIADMHPNPSMIEVCVSSVSANGTVDAPLSCNASGWSGNKLLISAESKLTKITPEEIQGVKRSLEIGQSWHALQRFAQMKREIEALRKRLYKASPTDVWTMNGKIGCIDRNGHFHEHKQGASCGVCSKFESYGRSLSA